ncbi:MAG: Uma2 family endonuclease [Gammaproteobacteria bacterium]|nr:Uma2 family endonuclease [Gammaproteobacteria bacterium]MCY4281733.1 Uma2 family endonuclease [Gammaproteobacteria bacterium]MCY4339531.1 Uma2 family endonuclease [Gammaproteobacteria bacterium]
MTPQSMSIDAIRADLQRFPEPLHLPLRYNSLGSPYVTIETDGATVARLAHDSVVNAFRRVMLDPLRGLVMLMSPSSRHEDLAIATDGLIEAITRAMRIGCTPLRATRWGDDNQGMVEADESYYVGAKADAYLAAKRVGLQAGERFTREHAPDLVVEATITHYDAYKLEAYKRLGVTEYWQLKADKRKDLLKEADVLLMEVQSDTAIAVSGLLPEVTPALLVECLNKLNVTSRHEWHEVVNQVLRARGIISIDHN